jgi:hypothetical protein
MKQVKRSFLPLNMDLLLSLIYFSDISLRRTPIASKRLKFNWRARKKMTLNTTKSELRNQHESQSDGFADVDAAKARPEIVQGNTDAPAQTENSIDDNAIRERAYQLYEESNRRDGNADEYWHQAERELKSRGR